MIDRVAPTPDWTIPAAPAGRPGARVERRLPVVVPAAVIEPARRETGAGFLTQLLAQSDGAAAAASTRPREAAARYAAPTRIVRQLGWIDV